MLPNSEKFKKKLLALARSSGLESSFEMEYHHLPLCLFSLLNHHYGMNGFK